MTAIAGTMWALRLHGAGIEKLRLEEVPTPRPGPGQLLVRVDACIACASDGKIVDQGSGHPLMYGWDLGRHPVIIGHEGCVTVAEVGERLADRYSKGGRFAVQPAVPAGPRRHRERYRNAAEGVGKIAIGYTLEGLFAEYALITEEVIETGCLLPLPSADMPHYAAALAEPLSCVVSAQEHSIHLLKASPTSSRRCGLGPRPGGVTAIIGAGPMGRMHAEIALRYDVGTIVVSDPIPERLEVVRRAVAGRAQARGTSLVLTSPERLEEALAAATRGRGADDVIVAVGVRAVQERAFELLAPGGVLNLFGGLRAGDHVISLDSRRLHYDSVIAVGSSGGDPSDLATALSLLAEGTVKASGYIAAVGGLDAARDLLAAVRAQELDGKGVIYPHARGPLERVEEWNAAREKAYLRNHGAVEASPDGTSD